MDSRLAYAAVNLLLVIALIVRLTPELEFKWILMFCYVLVKRVFLGPLFNAVALALFSKFLLPMIYPSFLKTAAVV